jgi:hypothetical protein
VLNVESLTYDNSYQNEQHGNFYQIPSKRESTYVYKPNDYQDNKDKVYPSRKVQWVPIEIKEGTMGPQGLPGQPGQPGPRGVAGFNGIKINLRNET